MLFAPHCSCLKTCLLNLIKSKVFMGAKILPQLTKSKDGNLLLASCQKNHDGSARFVMMLPPDYAKDPGLALLARCEALYSGYEYPYRSFLDRHLMSGDLFIDVGAHFGIYSLSAASAPCGDVSVVAIEPDPRNSRVLKLWAKLNQRDNQIEIVKAACGLDTGSTKLWSFSTMGHQTGALPPKEVTTAAGADIEMTSIDKLLAEREGLSKRRTFIKVDVEGGEPAVLDGADEALKSGKIAAIILEKSMAYGKRNSLKEFHRVLERLLELGFRFLWFPHIHMPGVLMPWVPGNETGNILAIAPSLIEAVEADPVYDSCFKPYPPPPPSLSDYEKRPYDRTARVRFTKSIIKSKATDGWRWCRPPNLVQGAEMRSSTVLPYLLRTGSLIDVGAGTMALFRKLPISVKYTPLDIVRFSKNTVIADLNQNQFPRGYWDMATLLGVLEYIHDVDRLLARLRKSAGRLYITYHGVPSNLSCDHEDRRACGYVNDHSEKELVAKLSSTGWEIIKSKNINGVFLLCAR